MAIDHCVFFKRKAETADAMIERIIEKLEFIGQRLDASSSLSHGPNVSPEGLGRGYDDGFIIRFSNAQMRDAYLVDSEHKAAGNELVAVIDGGVDGLFVFDLEVT